MNTTHKLTVTEAGSGLPDVGEIVYRYEDGAAFRVIRFVGPIVAAGPGAGVSATVEAEESGNAYEDAPESSPGVVDLAGYSDCGVYDVVEVGGS